MTVATKLMIIGFMLTMAMGTQADTIDTAGQAPYEQCGYCHEYDGNSLMQRYPRLAGQPAEYIAKQLHDFRSGKREGEMQATAELLSNEDIEIVAEYFSSQTTVIRLKDAMPEAQARVAERLIHDGDKSRDLPACVSCHAEHLRGRKSVPRLAGQHQEYLAKQLTAFKSGERANDAEQQMRSISRVLTEGEIQALAKYMAAMEISEQRGEVQGVLQQGDAGG